MCGFARGDWAGRVFEFEVVDGVGAGRVLCVEAGVSGGEAIHARGKWPSVFSS